MWDGMERSPAIAAPGSNNYRSLIASATSAAIGSNARKFQAPTKEELYKEYQPLVRGIAACYSDQGVDFEDLQYAGLIGLTLALNKFDPELGAFGAYAKHWIRGEILNCFKTRKDALSFGRTKSLHFLEGDDKEHVLLSRNRTSATAPARSQQPH